jgi:hypothetical protein
MKQKIAALKSLLTNLAHCRREDETLGSARTAYVPTFSNSSD